MEKRSYWSLSKEDKKEFLASHNLSKFWDIVFPILLLAITVVLFITETCLIFFKPKAAGILFIIFGLCLLGWIIWGFWRGKKAWWINEQTIPFKPRIKIKIEKAEKKEKAEQEKPKAEVIDVSEEDLRI